MTGHEATQKQPKKPILGSRRCHVTNVMEASLVSILTYSVGMDTRLDGNLMPRISIRHDLLKQINSVVYQLALSKELGCWGSKSEKKSRGNWRIALEFLVRERCTLELKFQNPRHIDYSYFPFLNPNWSDKLEWLPTLFDFSSSKFETTQPIIQ